MTALEVRTEEAIEALAEEGSPAAIASRLEAMGIKGSRGVTSSCPIAKYLQQNVEGGHRLRAGIIRRTTLVMNASKSSIR